MQVLWLIATADAELVGSVQKHSPTRNQHSDWTGGATSPCQAAALGAPSASLPPWPHSGFRGERQGWFHVLRRGQAGSPKSLVLNQRLDFVHKIPGELQDLFGVVALSHFWRTERESVKTQEGKISLQIKHPKNSPPTSTTLGDHLV